MLNPLLQSRRSKGLGEDDLIQLRHDMMCCYGWIPLKEFREMNIPELFQLYEKVQKEMKIRYTSYQATMGAAGMKKNQVAEVFK